MKLRHEVLWWGMRFCGGVKSVNKKYVSKMFLGFLVYWMQSYCLSEEQYLNKI